MRLMRKTFSTLLRRLVVSLAVLLMVKVTVAVVGGYREYFPPSFSSEFLREREPYFFGSYQWAFYSHIVSGPVSLMLGLLLISAWFRLKFPVWHRRLGRVQGMTVLLVVAPSGLWMSWYASAGPVASVSFAMLSILTGICVALGWQAAMKRRFADHRRWMMRSFILLCSAVVIRVLGGLGTVLSIESPWFNPVASWASWLVPLALLEAGSLRMRCPGRGTQKKSPIVAPSRPPSAGQSRVPEIDIQSRR